MLSEHWANDTKSLLRADEQIQGWIELDLDNRLKFAKGLVAVTNQRLLAKAPDNHEWAEWLLQAGLELNTLTMPVSACLNSDRQQRLINLALHLKAATSQTLQLITEFNQQESIATGQPVLRKTDDFCPKCNTPLPPGEDVVGSRGGGEGIMVCPIHRKEWMK